MKLTKEEKELIEVIGSMSMETRTQEKVSTREQLKDIALDVTWAKIAQKYFGKSSSWIYNKINEIDGNGGKGGFTEEERKQFKAALYDLAERIRRTADNFD
jgi:hypothetical protein